MSDEYDWKEVACQNINECLEKGKLTANVFTRVKELRCGKLIHSWRRISEIICDEFPEFVKDVQGYDPVEIRGNQLHGMYDLCEEAMEYFGENTEEGREIWN